MWTGRVSAVMEQSGDLLGLLHGIRRRGALVAWCALAGTLLALASAIALPPSYVSTAKILIESQQIPRELASSTVTSSTAERLEIIEQRLMTRDSLLRLIDRLGLAGPGQDTSPLAEVERLREATTLERIVLGSDRHRQARIAAFTLAVEDSDPMRAARIANAMVSLVLNQNLETRAARASETFRFFQREVDRLQAALTEAEDDIAEFQAENAGRLPDSLAERREDHARAEDRLARLAERQAALADWSAWQAGADARSAAADPAQARPQTAGLAELRRLVAGGRDLIGGETPAQRRLRDRLTEVEAQVLRAMVAGGEASDEAGAARQRAQRPGDPPNIAETAMAARDLLAEAEAVTAAEIASLAASIGQTPVTALELAAMQRRHALLQEEHALAVAKRAAAATGRKLEDDRQAERFEVIETAEVPLTPAAPNRPLIVGAGAATGLGAGLGLALLLALIDPTLRTARDLEAQLALSPLAVIPVIETPEERVARRRWRLRLPRRSVAAGMIALAIAPGAASWAPRIHVLSTEMAEVRQIDPMCCGGSPSPRTRAPG